MAEIITSTPTGFNSFNQLLEERNILTKSRNIYLKDDIISGIEFTSYNVKPIEYIENILYKGIGHSLNTPNSTRAFLKGIGGNIELYIDELFNSFCDFNSWIEFDLFFDMETQSLGFDSSDIYSCMIVNGIYIPRSIFDLRRRKYTSIVEFEENITIHTITYNKDFKVYVSF